MNVKLLKQVRDEIVAHPENYYQGSFCGTQHCIAGYAVAIASPRVWREAEGRRTGLISEEAQRVLQLTGDQALRLFSPIWDWLPEKLRLYRHQSPETRARRAVARIDHFIKTKGAE